MSSPPSLFSEEGRQEPQLARPLTHAESRADVLRMVEEEDDEARGFAIVMAEGSAEVVADLKRQVTVDGFLGDPDRINALRPSPEVLERLRAKVEARLLRGYDVGTKQGLDAIAASTKPD